MNNKQEIIGMLDTADKLRKHIYKMTDELNLAVTNLYNLCDAIAEFAQEINNDLELKNADKGIPETI